MRDHGRHAHVWLLLASPTGEQITSFQHKQTTYVFKKDHKNNVGALLGQVARVCPPFSPLSASLCLRLPQTQADSELPALHYRPSTLTNRASSASCTSLPRRPRRSRRRKSRSLFNSSSTPVSPLFPLILFCVTSAGNDADQNTRQLCLQGSFLPRTTGPLSAPLSSARSSQLPLAVSMAL